MPQPNVNFEFWRKACAGQKHLPECPVVIYENEDGRCYHHACEGRHPDCGKIVGVCFDTLPPVTPAQL